MYETEIDKVGECYIVYVFSKSALYGRLSLISQTIQIRWTRWVGQCYRSEAEFVSGILRLTPTSVLRDQEKKFQYIISERKTGAINDVRYVWTVREGQVNPCDHHVLMMMTMIMMGRPTCGLGWGVGGLKMSVIINENGITDWLTEKWVPWACHYPFFFHLKKYFSLDGSVRQWPWRSGFNPRLSHT